MPRRRNTAVRTRRNRGTSSPKKIPPIAKPQDPNYVADWAEFYVAYFGETLSRATLRSYLEGATGSETGFDLEAAWLELKRRVVLYGDNPPYKIEDTHLEQNLTWNNRPEYMACLIWALRGNPTQPTRAGKLFERISGEAATKYINGDLLITGFPSHLRAKEIAQKLDERFQEEPRRSYKDRGVDLVVWKKFNDARHNQIILLVQCACGSNWRRKAPLPIRSWNRYISWACLPTTSLTIPVVVTQDEMQDISEEMGLLMDRTRLYRNTEARTLEDRSLRRDLLTWCNQHTGLIIRGS